MRYIALLSGSNGNYPPECVLEFRLSDFRAQDLEPHILWELSAAKLVTPQLKPPEPTSGGTRHSQDYGNPYDN